jgi:hypothetical protein
MVFIFHLCEEHNYVTSSQDRTVCGAYFMLLCDYDDGAGGGGGGGGGGDCVTFMASFCIIVFPGRQYPVQHTVLQCMMASCGYLLDMMAMPD